MSLRLKDSLGPSIIITASVVGVGELIVAPRLGATVGLSALWLILLGCVIKVFLQEEFGRHTILTGDTTLEALNRVPGPRWKLSWAAWCWVLLLVAGTSQMGGILATVTQSLQLLHVPGLPLLLAAILTVVTAAVLMPGRYGLVEAITGFLVAGFTLVTIVAVVLLQRTEFRLSPGQILDGLRFRIPEHGFADAVAVFGITGIGTAELLFYPYWCLAKGYAKGSRESRLHDPSVIRGRIRGMRVDIAVALVIYTFATLAFFVLGATILHDAREVPGDLTLVQTLSQMYTKIFGEWVFYTFVVGAFFVLYSTFFVAMATWARMCADTARMIRGGRGVFNERRATNLAIVGLSVVYWLLCAAFKHVPQWLILSGAVMQTLLLPVFGVSILLIRRRRDDLFRPGAWFDWTLRLSVAIIALAAGYSAWRLVRGG